MDSGYNLAGFRFGSKKQANNLQFFAVCGWKGLDKVLRRNMCPPFDFPTYLVVGSNARFLIRDQSAALYSCFCEEFLCFPL